MDPGAKNVKDEESFHQGTYVTCNLSLALRYDHIMR